MASMKSEMRPHGGGVYAGALNPYNSEAYSAVSNILDHPLMARVYQEDPIDDEATFSDALAQVNSDMTGLCRRMKMRTRDAPEEVINRPDSWHVDPNRGVVFSHAPSVASDPGARDRSSNAGALRASRARSSRSNKTPRYSEISSKLPPLREGTYVNYDFAPSKRGRDGDNGWNERNNYKDARSNSYFYESEASIWDDQPSGPRHVPMQEQPFARNASIQEQPFAENDAGGAGKILQHGMWVSSRIEKLMSDVESMKSQIRPRLDRNSLISDLKRQVESLEQRAGLPPRSAAVSNPAPTSRLPPLGRDDGDSVKSADAAIPGPKASESPTVRKGKLLSRKEFEQRDQQQQARQARASRENRGNGNRNPQQESDSDLITPRPPGKGAGKQDRKEKKAVGSARNGVQVHRSRNVA